MREIKFRVYDKKKKKMIYSSVRDLCDCYTCICESCGDCNGSAYSHENDNEDYDMCRLIDSSDKMQFTGLQDKNGKDIYEGDLIKHRGIIMECEFSGSCFVFKNDKEHIEETCDMIGEVEVIGNIYEDPELLGDDSE